MKKIARTGRPSPRLASEREVWQRVQKRGKTSFLIRSTLSISLLLFALACLADRLWKHHAVPLSDLLWQAGFAVFLGYNTASLLWTRGEALINRTMRR